MCVCVIAIFQLRVNVCYGSKNGYAEWDGPGLFIRFGMNGGEV